MSWDTKCTTQCPTSSIGSLPGVCFLVFKGTKGSMVEKWEAPCEKLLFLPQ